MSRRSEIVSPKHILRDMVLKHGGAMGLTEILKSPQFRHHDENDIRIYVYQLRKEYKGLNLSYGLEAWELLHKVVIGLERCLNQRMRWEIQKRRHAKEKGVAEQTIIDNIAFQKKIETDGVVHKKEIIHTLEASTKDLQQAASSSTSVRETLVEHGEDFEGK